MEKISLGENTPPKNNEEKKISRRDLLKGGAAAVLLGGVVKTYDSIVGGSSDEELEKIDKEKAEERRDAVLGEPDVIGEHIKNRYAGYADIDHFLEDYSEVRNNPEELEDAERYFEKQENK